MTFVLSCIAITFAVSFLPLHLFFTVTDLGLWGITAQNIKVMMRRVVVMMTMEVMKSVFLSLIIRMIITAYKIKVRAAL